jgi:hypothetical protein
MCPSLEKTKRISFPKLPPCERHNAWAVALSAPLGRFFFAMRAHGVAGSDELIKGKP